MSKDEDEIDLDYPQRIFAQNFQLWQQKWYLEMIKSLCEKYPDAQLPPETQQYLLNLLYDSTEFKKLYEIVMLNFAATGAQSHRGHKKREDYQDKADCQKIAKALWEKDQNITIAALERSPELKPYKNKYSDPKTIRKWLSEIDPRPKQKRIGRPKRVR